MASSTSLMLGMPVAAQILCQRKQALESFAVSRAAPRARVKHHMGQIWHMGLELDTPVPAHAQFLISEYKSFSNLVLLCHFSLYMYTLLFSSKCNNLHFFPLNSIMFHST
uniref:Uncharacterized protein n=1 Tax=Micrurus paraensis TaxID=1970185 RepID=A0A2D4KWQ6_9SAUR